MTTRRRRQLLVVLLAAAALLLSLGWRTERNPYLSSLLQSLGVAALLVVPLLLIERAFELRATRDAAKTRAAIGVVADRVDVVASDLSKTRRSVADLQAQMRERLARASDADAELVRRAREDVTLENLLAAFARARELRAISEHGLRVALPNRWERLRFRPIRSADSVQGVALELAVVSTSGEEIGVSTVWLPWQDAEEVLFALVEVWKREGTYPGDEALDAQAIFDRLLASLRLALRSRNEGGDDQLFPLIELLSDTWALTDYGLEQTRELYYYIDGRELVSDAGLETWRGYMRDKRSVREDDEAARTAGDMDFHGVSLVAHQWFARNPPTQG